MIQTWQRPTYRPVPLSDKAYRALIRAAILRASDDVGDRAFRPAA